MNVGMRMTLIECLHIFFPNVFAHIFITYTYLGGVIDPQVIDLVFLILFRYISFIIHYSLVFCTIFCKHSEKYLSWTYVSFLHTLIHYSILTSMSGGVQKSTRALYRKSVTYIYRKIEEPQTVNFVMIRCVSCI